MKCSFVIPTKDRPRFFMMALESIRPAKRAGDEVVVVDGSTGVNAEHMAELVGSCGIVNRHILSSSKQVEATNEGVRASTGDIVRVFSDDDFVLADGHLKTLEVIDRNPDIDIFVAGGLKFRTDGEAIGIVSLGEEHRYGQSVDSIFICGSFGGGQFIRRRVFEQIGYFEDISIYDKEIAMRAVQNGLKVRFVRLMTYIHPIYPHSGVVSKKELAKREFYSLIEAYKPERYVSGHFLYPPVWDGAIV